MKALRWLEKRGSLQEHGVESVSTTLKNGGFQGGDRQQEGRVYLGEEGDNMSK